MTKLLITCSSGGHLDQAIVLAEQLGLNPAATAWATFDKVDARSKLARIDVPLRFPTNRHYGNLAINLKRIRRYLTSACVDLVLSTGAGAGLAGVFAARATGVPAIHIEPFDRVSSLTITGAASLRLKASVLGHAYPSPTHRNYFSTGGLVEWSNCEPRPHSCSDSCHVASLLESYDAVVLGGTHEQGFPRLAHVAQNILPRHMSVLLQGCHTVDAPTRGGVDHIAILTKSALQHYLAKCSVAIIHAGPGLLAEALRFGHRPVIVPRRGDGHEAVDDHQFHFAQRCIADGLAVSPNSGPLSTTRSSRALKWQYSPETLHIIGRIATTRGIALG